MNPAEEIETSLIRPELPASSCLSMRSDASKNIIIEFSRDAAKSPVKCDKSDLPASSCMSLKSDAYMNIIHTCNKNAINSSITNEKTNSPASACLSMKSNASINIFHDFTKEATASPVTFEKSDSCLSLKSDASINILYDFSKDVANRGHPSCLESKSMDGATIFQLVEEHAKNILLHELKRFKRMLFPNLPPSSESDKKNHDSLSTEDTGEDTNASEGALKITLHVLKKLGKKQLANTLEKNIYGELDVCQRKLRRKLKKFEYIYEGMAQHGNQTLLNKVYTELYITEGVCGGVNNEHEVRQVEAAMRRRATEDKPIKLKDIFEPLPEQDMIIRTVLTKGIAGIGKTISVQKFNLEWAEGRVNQDIQLLLNLPFRELNLMTEKRYTLTQLLYHFLAEEKESGISNFGKYKLALIFDGLDECRLPLDFDHNEPCYSVSEPTSVDVLLTNLIKGNLLPSAHIWITSRPAAANRIPADLVNRVTEIRGFNNPQKEEYFRKKISDQDMARKVISHVKSIRSLHIMCHIPVFSWISATVLQNILEETESPKVENGSRGEMPETLTQMYAHFLVYNSMLRLRKYSTGKEASEIESQNKTDEEMILKLGKLAFEHLMKGNMIFYENELHEYNISVKDAAIFSGVFTQVSKDDFGLHPERVYCFVHLSIQEFFAAMYAFHRFVCFNQNLLDPQEPTTVQESPSEVTSLLQSAVDKALQSNNGHLDLFLRFLLGLSQTTNQALLKKVLTKMKTSSPGNDAIIEYIKAKIHQTPSPERCINLFHCLSELNDQSLLEEIQHYLNSGSLSETTLSPSQWSALVFMLLTSKEELDEFDLREYSRSEEGLLRLLPVIKESRVALLKECNLTDNCCKALGELLSESCLKELDLSDNDLQDSGLELLSAGMASPTCQLEKLRMRFCGITETGCDFLSGALRSNPNHLKELDLSFNHPGQRGTELLSSVQEDIKHLDVSLTNNGECYLKSSLRKYACHLTMDVNTAHVHLSFSEGQQKMAHVVTAQSYPDSPERFTGWGQVLCKEGLSSRCYWEVEWTGEHTGIGVAYKQISRTGKGNESVLGYNTESWNLRYCKGKYTAWHNRDNATTSVPYFNSKRVGVFLDWSAGTLSFYAVSSNTMTHLHTFHVKFSEPLYPGFRLGEPDTSLNLCQL
ncbi:NLR family CARD domain-containing protein 3-like [Cheilinus undulatus]|uniref:NLR family CARD domain-containing protein 3-like n=1 Tax=Cheilinus undulatus TaxID=241271 RepID=UPI001BD5ABFB|nr:NLR family CARD domain-containing protein 3-like [Cheilinus undulatus]XP_041651238.1 NLR family CARD domain-containing protein 3-like [Cheilinus undulatus]XP_041651239.1 NLR family CARD domain-containing protein 3-like [Cheilinus undulatus]